MNITPEIENGSWLPPIVSARNCILQGRVEDLHFVPFHANGTAPVSRRVLAGAGVHETMGKHIVSHEVRNVPLSAGPIANPTFTTVTRSTFFCRTRICPMKSGSGTRSLW
jgi:hypothetical protein